MMRILIFWLLFPLVLPQALYVRRTATRFSPAQGPSEGTTGSGSPVRLLAVGDSIVAGVGAPTLTEALVGQTALALTFAKECSVQWKAMGVSGHDAQDLLDSTLPKLSGEAYDYIIVSVGVNDITGLTSLRKWRENLADIIERLLAHSPGAVIAFAGMPPMHGFPLLPQPLRAVFGMRAKVFDVVTRQALAGHPNAVHVPVDFDPDPAKFSADGYHPSAASYTEFGRHMAEGLGAAKYQNNALTELRSIES